MTAINTHSLVKELVASGLPEQTSVIIGNAILNGRNTDNLATKEQVGTLEKQVDLLEKEQVDIKTDIKIIKNDISLIKDHIKENMVTKAELKAELSAVKSEFKNDLNTIKTEIAVISTQLSNIKWWIPICVSIGVAWIKYF